MTTKDETLYDIAYRWFLEGEFDSLMIARSKVHLNWIDSPWYDVYLDSGQAIEEPCEVIDWLREGF